MSREVREQHYGLQGKSLEHMTGRGERESKRGVKVCVMGRAASPNTRSPFELIKNPFHELLMDIAGFS